MSTRYLKMLHAAVSVLLEEVHKVQEWNDLETRAATPNAPALPEDLAVRLSDLQCERGSILDGLDEALVIYAEARNNFADADELGVRELSVTFSNATFYEMAEENRKEDT